MTEKDDGRAAPARGSQPVYDDTDVPDDVLKDANRTTPDVDRGAFNPRGRLGAAGKAGKGAFLIGACFVGFIVYSMAEQSGNPTGTVDEDRKSTRLNSSH